MKSSKLCCNLFSSKASPVTLRAIDWIVVVDVIDDDHQFGASVKLWKITFSQFITIFSGDIIAGIDVIS